jgi:hypothetical protein
MADLWTAYMTLQSLALGAMLVLYMRYWTFQVTAGVIPKAIARFLTDGVVITIVVALLCAALACVLTTLSGPAVLQATSFPRAFLLMAETFVTGDTGLKEPLLEVRFVSSYRGAT